MRFNRVDIEYEPYQNEKLSFRTLLLGEKSFAKNEMKQIKIKKWKLNQH